jgi:hypothetical protein
MEEIKKLYPDEWLILGDPVEDEKSQRTIAATVMYHSADMKELVDMDKPLMRVYKRHQYLFNQVTPRKDSFLPLLRTWGKMTVVYDNGPRTPIKSIYHQ